ncbi:ATP-binding cassette domain-containing protein [Curtobacterium sp. MCLR17_032]|uniref:ABC transporter ATP-binding protein n=1 Tax=Curtobacterium sp. MCLR17_032 TaxID=2175650 RepID=UPI000DA9B7A6|nr:ATP-binding cassette domain-containing protein [Curtobacterium sp. MCLR17_032]WIE61642.1 ATP-binding cassette domain-containing protein [Curtobacterium sp. MCLR17_032]
MTDALLRTSGLRVTRGGRDLLHDVELTVRAGEHWALLGPNGAGKSTLLAVLGATGHPSAGTVELLGHRLGRADVRQLREHIGHVDPRHRMLSPLTVLETVLTGLTGTTDLMVRWEPTAEQVARAEQHVADVGLSARRDARWPVLSQGERGRALIARALMAEPRLLLLDEPATGLDVAAREHLLETVDALRVRQPELGSVMVTHHLEDLPASTSHAMLLRDGAVVAQGRADEVISSARVSAAFDFPLAVERSGGRWHARRAD